MMSPIGTTHILFSLANTIQHLLSYHACFIGIQPKRKSNDHFEIVECSPTCRGSQIASLGAYRAKRFTLIYRSDGRSDCRGYYPEQLHQFHFRHPYIVAWDIYSAKVRGQAGETILFPATTQEVNVCTDGHVKFLETYV